METDKVKEKLMSEIKNLNDRERTILSLYYYEDLNYKEIAQILNLSVQRVSTIHMKCLERLKECIDKEE